MRMSDFHRARLQEDPEYDDAVIRVSAQQDFADEIVERRIALRWTQAELARQANMTQPEVSRVENGAANPTLETIAKLRAALQRGEAARSVLSSTPGKIHQITTETIAVIHTWATSNVTTLATHVSEVKSETYSQQSVMATETVDVLASCEVAA